ncbi:unnamed protein product [Closterium sp. NIES-53]
MATLVRSNQTRLHVVNAGPYQPPSTAALPAAAAAAAAAAAQQVGSGLHQPPSQSRRGHTSEIQIRLHVVDSIHIHRCRGHR